MRSSAAARARAAFRSEPNASNCTWARRITLRVIVQNGLQLPQAGCPQRSNLLVERRNLAQAFCRAWPLLLTAPYWPQPATHPAAPLRLTPRLAHFLLPSEPPTPAANSSSTSQRSSRSFCSAASFAAKAVANRSRRDEPPSCSASTCAATAAAKLLFQIRHLHRARPIRLSPPLSAPSVSAANLAAKRFRQLRLKLLQTRSPERSRHLCFGRRSRGDFGHQLRSATR